MGGRCSGSWNGSHWLLYIVTIIAAACGIIYVDGVFLAHTATVLVLVGLLFAVSRRRRVTSRRSATNNITSEYVEKCVVGLSCVFRRTGEIENVSGPFSLVPFCEVKSNMSLVYVVPLFTAAYVHTVEWPHRPRLRSMTVTRSARNSMIRMQMRDSNNSYALTS